MANIKQVAAAAGVSVATVSRYVNKSGYVGGKSADKIEKAIRELDYLPNAMAVGLKKQQTSTIGVLIPEIGNPFYSELIKGISDVADQNQISLLLSDSSENMEKELRTLKMYKQQQVSGLIITPVSDTREENPEFYDILESFKIPTIFIDREVEQYETDGIYYDNYGDSFKAGVFVANKEDYKVCVLAGNQKLKIGQDRLQGFMDGYRSINTGFTPVVLDGDFSEEKAYDALNEFLDSYDCPDIIYSANNMMSKGVLKTLHERKLFDRVEMFSYDYLDYFDITPMAVHYFDRDVVHLGEEAMKMMLDRFKDLKGPIHKHLHHSYIK